MKINNVEKFRNELYTAINDGIGFMYEIDTPSAIWKGSHADFVDSMKEHCWYDVADGDTKCISLPHPMIIRNEGKTIYLTIDEDGAWFFENEPEQYVRNLHVDADFYKNKMSFAIRVTERINYLFSL